MRVLNLEGIVVLVLVMMGACAGPERSRVLGMLEHEAAGAPLSIEVASEAARGTRVQMEINTYGALICTVAGPTEVKVEGELSRRVTVYDWELLDRPCADKLVRHQHEAELRFDRVGEATVVVRGWSGTTQDTLEVSRTVQIR